MATAFTIEIEKGVPPPPTHKGKKYPFGDMDVGDSFLVPGAKVTTLSVAKRDYERGGRKFICRTVDDGVRVWRVA